jgi:hypothetical protein
VLEGFWLPCLAVAVVAAEDEGRHRRGPELLWGESWYFDLAAADASLGGFVRIGLYPNLGVAWFWAALVGQGRRLVLVRDHEVELPRGASIEVRGQGLWSAVNCETPLDHWSVGLEAFAVAFDDPAEAWGDERGDLVGLGFDLEWEAIAPAFGPVGPIGHFGYAQACRVTGEILVGDEQLEFDGRGHRGHAWGVQDWWETSRCRASGSFEDGTTFLLGTDADGSDGCAVEVTRDVAGLPTAATVAGRGLSLDAAVMAPVPLLLAGPDGRLAYLARALCRCRSGDGRHGGGWAEWLDPHHPAGSDLRRD